MIQGILDELEHIKDDPNAGYPGYLTNILHSAQFRAFFKIFFLKCILLKKYCESNCIF